MHRRRDGQRLAGEVDAREDLPALGDAREPFGQHLGIDVIEVEVDMIAIRPMLRPSRISSAIERLNSA